MKLCTYFSIRNFIYYFNHQLKHQTSYTCHKRLPFKFYFCRCYISLELSPQQLPSVPCPLTDAYHYSYVNNSGGLCTYPASYVTPCSAVSRVRFHFKRCPDAAYSYERGMTCHALSQLDCRRRLLACFRWFPFQVAEAFEEARLKSIFVSLKTDQLCSFIRTTDKTLTRIQWAIIQVRE